MNHLEKLELIEDAKLSLPDPRYHEANRIRIIQINKNEELISRNMSAPEIPVTSPYYEVEFIKIFENGLPIGWEFSGLYFTTGTKITDYTK
jgi:hypothetical protein